MKAWNYLSGWTSFALPNNIQKRLYKFVLRRAIGQFLQNELDLENFDIALIDGNLELRDLDLNLQFINKLLIDTPFQLENGSVSSISASIPWAKLLSGDISLKIHGLQLTLRPIKNKPKPKDTESTTPTEEPLLSSSLHFADDFLRTEIEEEQTQELHKSIQESFHDDSIDVDTEGLQVLTKVIDKMMARVKIDIVDTLIRVIHKSAVPLTNATTADSLQEYYVDIRVPRISYFDETPEFNHLNPQQHNDLMESSVLLPPVANETIKIITVESPEIWLKSAAAAATAATAVTGESSIYTLPTQSETTIHSDYMQESDYLGQTEFFETEQGRSSLFQSKYRSSTMSGSVTPKANASNINKPYEALLFTTMDKRNFVRMKLRPSLDGASFMSIKQLDFLITHIRAILSPQQIAFFMDLLDTMTSDTTTDAAAPPSNQEPQAPKTTNALLDDLDTFNNTTLHTNTPFNPLSSQHANVLSPKSDTVDLKVKIKLSLVELLVLADDAPIKDNEHPEENKNHIRLAVQDLNVRMQQFPTLANKRRSSSDFHLQQQTLSSITDIRIADITLNEWICQPPQARKMPFANSRSQTRYDVYIPIFQFDNRIKSNYHDEELFPAYYPSPPSQDNTADAVRIRIEKKQSRELGRFVEAISFDEDINVDIKPFKLQIDPRIIDRLDNYIYAITDFNKHKEGQTGNSFGANASPKESRPSVFDDLQSQENIQKRKVRVRCAFIRLLLFVPDMSQSSTREEFNDRFHESQLSVDIKKLVGTWCSTTTVMDDYPSSLDSEDHPHRRKLRFDQAKMANKVNIELNYVNVFMHLKQDDMARCWFTAKTVQGNNKIFSEGSLSPTIEITIQDPNAVYPISSSRSSYFGAGSDIPTNLFSFLSRNENFNGDQKLHIPMDEQSESAMIFKQRTIETSLFVVNCHFPQADMKLTKQIWDKVQIIQNDLLLWQPRFLLRQQQQMDLSSSMDFHTDTRSTSSMMSQSHERLVPMFSPDQQPYKGYFPNQSPQPVQKQTLFSIVAVMSNGIWDIHTSPEHTYCLQFSEFRYFAAMRHLGQNENMTTLDIEDLDLFDVSNKNKVSLLYKTIPKKIHPKRNTSMVSLFSRLTLFPESNRINKVTSIVACNVCWKATANIDFVNQIIDFQKVPEEMVFIDPPTQYIKIYAHILETSIDYEPIHSPTRAVVILDGVQVITNILAGQPMIDITTFVQNIELYLIDDKQELNIADAHQRLEGKTTDARKYWATLGFASILSIQNIELSIKLKLDEHILAPQAEISLISTDICIASSADSFQTLVNLITFISNNGDVTIPSASATTGATASPSTSKRSQNSHQRKRRPLVHQINTRDDMLASLDENAFKTSPKKMSPPTLIEAPEMEEFSYVEEFYHQVDENGNASVPARPAVPPTKPRRKQHRIKTSEDIIRVLISNDSPDTDDESPLQFKMIEDFFGVEKKAPAPKSVVDITKAILSLRVSNINVIWKLYDGYEWDYVRTDMATRELKEIQLQQEMQLHQGSPSERQTGFGEDLINAGLKKKKQNKSGGDAHIEIKLSTVSVDFDLMPEKDTTALYFHLLVKDVEIIDNIKTSDWKKFLGYMKSSVELREVDACMVDVELISLRPVQDDPQQEFRLKVKLLPTRLYVDQDAMIFLQKYFEFDKSYLRSTQAANQSIAKSAAKDEEDSEQNELDDDDLDSQKTKEATCMFFQYVDIYPITLKVDYKPKVFNLGNFKEGQLAELMNLFRLDGAEISLSHVKLTGIKGIDGLLDRLGQEWLPHILNTQKMNMVSGVSPVRSIVNLSTGVSDLVLLPIQQYRKDGRLMKGIQRGTSSFARATAIEAIKLSSRVATGTQVILEHADGFFSSNQALPIASSSSNSHLQQQDQHFVYTDINGVDITCNDDDLIGGHMDGPFKPSTSSSAVPLDKPSSDKSKYRRSLSSGGNSSDLTEGLQHAYQNISKNLGSAAQTIFAVPTDIQSDHRNHSEGDYQYSSSQGSSSSSSSAKAVIRAVPVAVIKPMIGLTGAFQSILTGLRNSIDPVMRLQSEDKYKKPK